MTLMVSKFLTKASLYKMAQKKGTVENLDELEEKIENQVRGTSITSDMAINKFILTNGLNIEYECSNELHKSFGLIGKNTPFAVLNKSKVYCEMNNYTCCSDSQIQTSMISFGKGVVNLKKNLEPLIELSIAIKTTKFVETFMASIRHPVCSKILDQAFSIESMNPNTNFKTFFKKIFK